MLSFVATMHEVVDPIMLAEAEALIQLPSGRDIEEEYTVFDPEIVIFKNLEELFEKAGEIVLHVLHENPSPILSLPTGNTPGKLYDWLGAKRVEDPQHVTFEHVFVRGLDEYWDKQRRYVRGQGGTFSGYFEKIVYGKNGLNVPRTNRLHPNIAALDPFVEAAVFEKRQNLQGPAHLAVLGIGRNGHIAFNEPGSPRYSRSRLVTLTQDTKEANKGESDGPFRGNTVNVPEYAITQGVSNILEAEQIIVLVTGEHKADALRSALEDEIDAKTPATFLRTHSKKQVIIFADIPAASRLPF